MTRISILPKWNRGDRSAGPSEPCRAGAQSGSRQLCGQSVITVLMCILDSFIWGFPVLNIIILPIINLARLDQCAYKKPAFFNNAKINMILFKMVWYGQKVEKNPHSKINVLDLWEIPPSSSQSNEKVLKCKSWNPVFFVLNTCREFEQLDWQSQQCTDCQLCP